MKKTAPITGMLIAALTVVLTVTCGSEEKLVFETRELVKTYGVEENEQEPFARVKASWPYAVSGPAAAVDSLNDFTKDFIRSRLGSFLPGTMHGISDPDSIAEAFIESYRSFREAFPTSAQRWRIDICGDIVYNNGACATLCFDLSAYTGGAHSAVEVTYVTLDARTGKCLTIDDIVTDTAELTHRAETEFRKTRGINPETNFSDAGFSFENNTFSLTDNFGILDNGIIFHYNPYEIAPWAMGPTEFIISYGHIRDILRPEYSHRLNR